MWRKNIKLRFNQIFSLPSSISELGFLDFFTLVPLKKEKQLMIVRNTSYHEVNREQMPKTKPLEDLPTL